MENNLIEDNFRNFLFAVARWKALDWFKQSNRHRVSPISIEAADLIIADPSANPLDQMVDREYMVAVLEIIRTTVPSDTMREVFLLRYMEGRSYREIANIIVDRPLSPEELVRETNRLRQGCKRLRAQVKNRIQKRLD